MGLTTPASHPPGPTQRPRSGVTAKAKALVSAEATSVNTRPHFVRTGRCSTVISSYWVKKKKKGSSQGQRRSEPARRMFAAFAHESVVGGKLDSLE